MTGIQQEKRRDLRVTFWATVKLSFSDGRTFNGCETTDVSVGGVFVKGVTGVDSGEQCQVALYLSGRTSKLVLELTGEIVRTQTEGVALQFSEVDEDSFYHLRNIVYFNYKHGDGAGNGIIPLEGGDDVEDASIYLVPDSSGKTRPLPDNYLDENNGTDSDDSALDDDVATHVSRYLDEDDC